MLLTQVEVEEKMYSLGIDRMRRRMQEAEQTGNADRNPYAATIYRDFILPLSAIIREDVEAKRAGARQAHVVLLESLDFDAVALIAVRTALTYALGQQRGERNVRQLGQLIGTNVHSELVLAQIERYNPDLYYTLVRDFERKRSKSTRHRLLVFRSQAEKAGALLDEWNAGSRHQVGLYLLDRLAAMGLVVMDAPPTQDGKKTAGKRLPMLVDLAPDIYAMLDNIKGIVEVTAPMYGPCVEPPKDWTSMTEGGFHTRTMRRTLPYLVKASGPARDILKGHEMPTVLEAVNALQRTAWRINTKVLDTVVAQAKARSGATPMDAVKPDRPEFLDTTEDMKTLSESQQEEFITWKRATRDWHLARKREAPRSARFYAATRVAETFRDYPSLYFVHFLDSRGRFYPLTYGVNPQGSDLQKALLEFAEGKRLSTPGAVKWFLIHGANKWGFDKAPLADREAWHKDKHLQLMAMASDPVNNNEWEQADNPLQFLAWVFEYAEWRIDPEGFESRIAVSMDGSCNGLQHFSAMLRDEVGGQATNLTDNKVMADIYTAVAKVSLQSIKDDPNPGPYTVPWITKGIERTVVKRSVMTTPYGVTRKTATEYVVRDYLAGADKPIPSLAPQEHFKAANYLMSHVWPSIGQVVVKAREAMDWLQTSARAIIRQSPDIDGVIAWVTPSGFLATQSYYELEEYRVNTRLHGSTRVRVVTEGESADIARHATGLAPNFVHSMDASHLAITTAHAYRKGIRSFAMIHDDFGTHAADAELMFNLIRECFVGMYVDNDPIKQFHDAYPMTPTPPTPGKLDIYEVLRSDFFFS